MTKPLILAAKGEKTDRLPVWFLRQAGRYLPEYMEIRKNIRTLMPPDYITGLDMSS